MTVAELAQSAQQDAAPPSSLCSLALALWYAKKCGNQADTPHWQLAHEIAQDIHTPQGSWTHALLHLIEGDQWNADYWFSRAGKPSHKPEQIPVLWEQIATEVLG
jgi:hypothetical protein